MGAQPGGAGAHRGDRSAPGRAWRLRSSASKKSQNSICSLIVARIWASLIVVPIDAERMRPLSTWTAVTTIMYNIAVAVAAVNSF